MNNQSKRRQAPGKHSRETGNSNFVRNLRLSEILELSSDGTHEPFHPVGQDFNKKIDFLVMQLRKYIEVETSKSPEVMEAVLEVCRLEAEYDFEVIRDQHDCLMATIRDSDLAKAPKQTQIRLREWAKEPPPTPYPSLYDA